MFSSFSALVYSSVANYTGCDYITVCIVVILLALPADVDGRTVRVPVVHLVYAVSVDNDWSRCGVADGGTHTEPIIEPW